MSDPFATGRFDSADEKRPPWLSIFVGVLCLIVGVLTVGAVVLSILAYSQALTDIHEIESSRRESIRLTCEEQNNRHTHTIQTLNMLIGRATKEHPKTARQVEQGRASTELLIDALAPLENCNARVVRFTRH